VIADVAVGTGVALHLMPSVKGSVGVTLCQAGLIGGVSFVLFRGVPIRHKSIPSGLIVMVLYRSGQNDADEK
jgi:hypothetical protein